jgi:hypothetical protein
MFRCLNSKFPCVVARGRVRWARPSDPDRVRDQLVERRAGMPLGMQRRPPVALNHKLGAADVCFDL